MSTLNLNYFELFGLNIEVSIELEELNKKSAFSKVPRLSLHYFGVKLEVELISFDGD